MPDGSYALTDLCDLANVTPRTVRYYIAQGLLRSPGITGPGARYDDGHLARLRLIRRLQREHLPLAEIRARLAALTDGEAIAQAEGSNEPPADSALDYVRGVLGGHAILKVAGPATPAPRPPAMPALRPPAPSPPGPPVGVGEDSMPWMARHVLAAEDVPGLAPDAPPPAAPAAATDDLALGGELAPPAPPEPPGAERSHWERFALAPDIELHVRRPLTRSQNRAVVRLLEAARQLLEEDQP